MSMSALHAEPASVDLHAPASAARNNSTQNFMSDGFLSRVAFFEAPAAEACDSHHAQIDQAAISHQSGLAARMRTLIRAEGSMASIARRCGFSEGAVRSWRDGQSDISRERCVVMARTLNVSLLWLITGEGPMRPEAFNQPTAADESAAHEKHASPQDHAAVRTGVDSRVLAAALRLLQSYVGLLGGSLSTGQRADVLAQLYDILRSADEPGYIDRLIAFHSMLSGQMRRGDSLVA
jgi:hypothetical protein